MCNETFPLAKAPTYTLKYPPILHTHIHTHHSPTPHLILYPLPLFLLPLPLRLQPLHKLPRRILPIPLNIILRPPPQILARLLERQLRLPSELPIRPPGITRQIQHVAGAPPHDLIRQVPSHSRREGLHHLEDGRALAGAEVPGAHAGAVFAEVVERHEVPAGEVQDVDVVADSGAVVGVVV